MRALGYEQVKKFSWERMTEETLQVYREILAQSKKNPEIILD